MKRAVDKRMLWLLWIVLNVSAGSTLMYKVFPAEDKRIFLPGQTTHGHYQIEMSCNECHTPFMGVKEDACIRCHGDELAKAQDSHPLSKFKDVTRLDMLKQVKADECIACHSEHNPDATHSMGVTLPDDYCGFCHQDIGEDRPSHFGLEFNTCANAGCHNYHDNRALYERFLRNHLDEADVLEDPRVPQRGEPRQMGPALTANDADADTRGGPMIIEAWAEDIHAAQGVNCTACHTTDEPRSWVDSPTPEHCGTCHKNEEQSWGQGRHGMRTAAGLSPMTPAMARHPMHVDAMHSQLDCNACHKGHDFDLQFAAVDACLQCHNDPHSNNYKDSPHYGLWQQELNDTLPAGSGVSCATCHMPRIEDEAGRVSVQHNQNDNLRPNEKMIRSVCINCHGVGFSINALADRPQVESCYNEQPSGAVETIDWVKKRVADIERRQREAQERRLKSKNTKKNLTEDDL